MAAANGMHGSDTLQNDIFGNSPRMVGLSEEVQKMLQQFSPEQTRSPAVSERISRISAIADALESVAWDTRKKLVNLYTETTIQQWLKAYESKVAVLEEHQRARVAEVLMMAA